MPWKEQRLETMRKEFVERVLSHEKSKSALCREYGISRPTGDKWIARYLSGEDLKDMNRAPKSRPNKTDPEIEKKIVEYREQYPAIGAVKMRRIMENAHHNKLPSSRTFNEIFKRNGLITKEASEAAKPYQHFEKEYPNEMWQGDFKGHFKMEEEKFNGSLTRECLKYNTIRNQAHASKVFAEYRDFYNNVRPHMSLGLEVPASRYEVSKLQYPERIREWEYTDELKIHKVKSSGYITIKGQGYFLSEAFGDKEIAFRESNKGANFINLYFRQFRIGQIDIEKRVFTFKRAYLISGDPREHAPEQ